MRKLPPGTFSFFAYKHVHVSMEAHTQQLTSIFFTCTIYTTSVHEHDSQERTKNENHVPSKRLISKYTCDPKNQSLKSVIEGNVIFHYKLNEVFKRTKFFKNHVSLDQRYYKLVFWSPKFPEKNPTNRLLGMLFSFKCEPCVHGRVCCTVQRSVCGFYSVYMLQMLFYSAFLFSVCCFWSVLLLLFVF